MCIIFYDICVWCTYSILMIKVGSAERVNIDERFLKTSTESIPSMDSVIFFWLSQKFGFPFFQGR